jgi:hypothetical protein
VYRHEQVSREKNLLLDQGAFKEQGYMDVGVGLESMASSCRAGPKKKKVEEARIRYVSSDSPHCIEDGVKISWCEVTILPGLGRQRGTGWRHGGAPHYIRLEVRGVA